jgi:xyloglucan-specific exo-beta-1,4-glucanase
VKGLEETVPLDMVSIPNGPVASAIGDYGGFRHTDVTKYVAAYNPIMGTTPGIAVASLNPNVMLRIGHEKMYYSEDSGITWTECNRTGSNGSVSVSADGKVLLYSHESGSSTYRSTDKGNSWTASSGLSISWSRPLADPINASKFYAYNPGSGKMMVSTDGGVSFLSGGTVGTGGSKIIRTVHGMEGHIWVALYNGGLARSSDSGQTFSKINGVTACGSVGIGKEAPGASYPTIFIYGTVNGVAGIHRSTDEGVTWIRVNDDAHEYGGPANGQFVQGDMNVFGRVYMSTAGRGIVYGESSQTCIPTTIAPNIKVGTAAVKQASVVTVNTESNITLGTNEITGGSWSWTGPNGFTATGREVMIENIPSEKAGIYKVRYTNAAGCQSSPLLFAVNVVDQSQPVTSSEESLQAELSVYPNPSQTSITLVNPKNIKEVFILNRDGRIIYHALYNDKLVEVPIHNLPPGCYLVEIVDNDNVKTTKKIVKQQ